MAKTIITVDEANINLVLSGNLFNLKIEQKDKSIHVTGKLQNGGNFIIDGVEDISQEIKSKELPPVIQPTLEDVTPTFVNPPIIPQVPTTPVVEETPEPVASQPTDAIYTPAIKQEEQLPDKPETEIPEEEEVEDTPPEVPEQPTQEPMTQHAINTIQGRSRKMKSQLTMKACANKIMEDLARGMKQKEVAEKYGVSGSTISVFYRKHVRKIMSMASGLTVTETVKDHAINWDPDKLPQFEKILIDLADDTMTHKDIAVKYNIPVDLVDSIYRKNLTKIQELQDADEKHTEVVENEEPEKPLVPLVKITPTEEIVEKEETPDHVFIPNKEDEDIIIDSDTEAMIINKLIDDIPIIKIAKDTNLPKERIQKVFFDHKDYISKAREARSRIPMRASEESLLNLVKEFASR